MVLVVSYGNFDLSEVQYEFLKNCSFNESARIELVKNIDCALSWLKVVKFSAIYIDELFPHECELNSKLMLIECSVKYFRIDSDHAGRRSIQIFTSDSSKSRVLNAV